jgi:hypothetical protein
MFMNCYAACKLKFIHSFVFILIGFIFYSLNGVSSLCAQPVSATLACTYSGITESASSKYDMPTGGGNLGRGASLYYYHFYKFDVSSIPAGSRILSVNLSLVCVQRVEAGSTLYSVNGQFNVTYRRLDTDPVTETAANLFSKIRTTTPTYGGTRLHSNAGTAGAPSRYTRPLSGQAVADLQTARDGGQSWFAIGLDHDNTTTNRWFRFTGHNYSDAAQRPYLVVTYITPSGETVTNLPTNYSQHVRASDNAKLACRTDIGNVHFQGRVSSATHHYTCFRFDISSLAGTTVKYANFSYYVHGTPLDGLCQFYSNVRRLDVDPATADGATLISKINTSPLATYNVADLATTFFPSSNTGRYEFTLNATGLADLQAAIDANQTWFALSFQHTFVGSMNQFFQIKGDCETNAALQTRITVGYTPGGSAISTSPVTSPFCAGASVDVPFTASGTFNPGNIFTAQLSNALGDFTSPTNIGTLTGTSSGTISAAIPGAAAAGAGYRIRVIGSNPATIGTNNGSNITINANPTVIAGAALGDICQSAASAAMGGSVGGSATGGTWSGGTGIWTNPTNPAAAVYTAGAAESGAITLTLTTSGGSCGTTSASKNIFVNPTPDITISGSPVTVCEPVTVDITESGIPNYVSDANATTGTYTYHASLADANAGTPVLGSFDASTAVESTSTIWIRKETLLGCSDVASIAVAVNSCNITWEGDVSDQWDNA